MSQAVYRCSNCGGNVKFDPGQQALTCPYCNHISYIEDLKTPTVQHEVDFNSALERFESMAVEEVRIVSCPACSGETTFPPNVESGACDFCGTNIVATGPTTKAMNPQYVLPFKIASGAAERIFRTWLQKRWFAPSALKKLARIEDPLKGIYFPFWTYDSETETDYTGERGENYTVEVRERDSDGNDVISTEVRTEWYPASGTISRFFDDVLIPASRSLPEELTGKLSEWDLQELAEYNPAVLSGFKAETYSVGLKDGFGEAQGLMENEITNDVRTAIGGDEQRILSINTRWWNVTFKYLQLPVWTLTYRFKSKFYQVIINGQNGEVAGKHPWSALKIALATLLGLAVIAGIVIVIQHFQS